MLGKIFIGFNVIETYVVQLLFTLGKPLRDENISVVAILRKQINLVFCQLSLVFMFVRSIHTRRYYEKTYDNQKSTEVSKYKAIHFTHT